MALSFLWICFLRYFAGVMSWLTILAANLLFISCTILSYQKARGTLAVHRLTCLPACLPAACPVP